jgi:hypothetical protein
VEAGGEKYLPHSNILNQVTVAKPREQFVFNSHETAAKSSDLEGRGTAAILVNLAAPLASHQGYARMRHEAALLKANQ